ncbi:MAG: DUF2142 domain-containing protein [Candidatus Saccharimonas sp.]|nr:MAG: DUF2142 domain-containing protein [Candidatus Saccharimonas sp.]
MGLTAIILSAFIGPSKDTTVFNSDKTTRRWLVLLAVIITAVYTAISLSIYIYWANYRSAVITSLQARYFIPIMPLISMTLSPPGTLRNQKRLKSFYSHLINHYLYC